MGLKSEESRIESTERKIKKKSGSKDFLIEEEVSIKATMERKIKSVKLIKKGKK